MTESENQEQQKSDQEEPSVAEKVVDRQKSVVRREIAQEAHRAERGFFRWIRRLIGLR